MVAPKPSAAAATIATVPPPPSSSEVLEEAYGPLLYRLLLERNHRETLPFADLHVSNAQLWQQVDALQHQCLQAEREVDHLRQQLIESALLNPPLPGEETPAAAAPVEAPAPTTTPAIIEEKEDSLPDGERPLRRRNR